MKAIYLTLALTILLAVLMGSPAVQFTAIGVGLGWAWYESRKTKEARQ